MRERLVSELTQRIYDNEMDGWLKTGDAALDRIAFSAIYYPFRIPFTMAVGIKAYNWICLANGSALSYLKGSTLLMTDMTLGNAAYFGLRDWMIDQ